MAGHIFSSAFRCLIMLQNMACFKQRSEIIAVKAKAVDGLPYFYFRLWISDYFAKYGMSHVTNKDAKNRRESESSRWLAISLTASICCEIRHISNKEPKIPTCHQSYFSENITFFVMKKI